MYGIDAQGGRRVRDAAGPLVGDGPVSRAPGHWLAGQSLWREHRRTRVLIADTEGQVRRQAQAPLELAGLKVDAARGAERAVAMAARADYGLVLLQLDPAGSEAFEAARRIRCLPATRRPPILGVTSHSSASTRQRCMDSGMGDCIALPFSPETLFAAALRLLRGPASNAAEQAGRPRAGGP